MNLRKFGWLFWTTLVVGGIGGILSGFLLGGKELTNGTLGNFFVGTFMNLLVGLTISVVAQMGLFAYMTLNFLALSFFKSTSLWKNVQIFLVLFAFFDMVYLRYNTLSRGESIWPYMIEPIALLFVAVITAYAKVNATNRTAFIPTIFFIFVFTAVEWIPGLGKDNAGSIIFMIVPLLFSNVWQVMNLHRVTEKRL